VWKTDPADATSVGTTAPSATGLHTVAIDGTTITLRAWLITLMT
jgi:hypothetical protein